MHANHLQFATNLAREAGALIKENFGLGTKKEWKADNSPLTATDTAINALVIEKIKNNFPGHSILGEEESFQVEGSSFTWVCDPIDGTIPFTTGIPISTFTLALAQNGQPILGVIYDPHSDRLFTAEKGKGAFLNSDVIQVSPQNTLPQSHIDCCGRRLLPMTEKLLDQKALVTSLYCLSCAGSLVACGEFEAAIFPGSSAWDVAALKIIVEEAGGKVTDLSGQEQAYDKPINGAIISNGHLHEQLLNLRKIVLPNL